jgi:DNA replication protein DnaC
VSDDISRIDLAAGLNLIRAGAESAPADDELARAVNKARQKLANEIPARYLEAEVTDPAVAAWVDRYHAGAATCGSMLLFGPTGVGKTWEAFGAVRGAVTPRRMPSGDERHGHAWTPDRWQYVTYSGLNDELRPRDNGKHRDVMDTYQRVPLLLVDDLGAGKVTDWTADTTYRLIDSRWAHCRPTIFTTNLPPAELTAVLGDRIVSRLAGMCVRVSLKGVDRRRAAA